jgi:hypothetical protein
MIPVGASVHADVPIRRGNLELRQLMGGNDDRRRNVMLDQQGLLSTETSIM